MTDKQLVEIEVITPRQNIDKERARLIALRDAKDEWWIEERRSDWARTLFGRTLVEKSTGTIYAEKKGDTTYIGANNHKGYCQICGENFGLDEEFVAMSFSFCDEYDCGMSIHKICPKLQEAIK